MASVAGSSSDAFFCVASRMNVSERITSSRALTDFSRPTNSGTIMCGKQRYPAVAAPDRLGFHLVQGVGVELSRSWPNSVLSLSPRSACAQPRQSTDGLGKEYGSPQR